MKKILLEINMQKNKSLNLPSCQILSNLKIIDFAEVFAGPFGISLMADLVFKKKI